MATGVGIRGSCGIFERYVRKYSLLSACASSGVQTSRLRSGVYTHVFFISINKNISRIVKSYETRDSFSRRVIFLLLLLSIVISLIGRKNHFSENVCLRPWSFERVPNKMIRGLDNALIYTSTKEACLAACLNEHRFTCRSVEYNYVTLQCHLSDSDRRTTGQYVQFVDAQGVDYFENLCLKGKNRQEYILKDKDILLPEKS